jgi:hypothetical protein
VVKVGALFDAEKRTLKEWVVAWYFCTGFSRNHVDTDFHGMLFAMDINE